MSRLSWRIRKERPAYAETNNRVRIRRQVTAYLGVRLDDRDDQVVISGVSPGGPAERGGLRIGDQLQQLGKRQIENSSQVLDVMRSRSPGDSLTIRYQRGMESREITVKLEPRP